MKSPVNCSERNRLKALLDIAHDELAGADRERGRIAAKGLFEAASFREEFGSVQRWHDKVAGDYRSHVAKHRCTELARSQSSF